MGNEEGDILPWGQLPLGQDGGGLRQACPSCTSSYHLPQNPKSLHLHFRDYWYVCYCYYYSVIFV